MDFTVVIPLFNKGPHVAASVRSALAQVLPPREVIVVDDGSSDGGLEAVQAIQDARIRLLTRSPPGPGGYAARNLGVRSAQTEWIAFLDADDLWHDNHLSSLADAISKCGEKVGCAFTRFEVVSGQKRRVYEVSEKFLLQGRPLSLNQILEAWLDQGQCPMCTCVVALRKNVLIEAGLFPEGRARRGGDKDTWLRSIAVAPAAFSPIFSVEVYEDSVNRVSTQTGHSQPPILTDTIKSLLPKVHPNDRKLLRAVSNKEIALYARFSARAGGTAGFRFISRIYFPGGLPTLGKVVLFAMLGGVLKSWIKWKARYR